METTTKINIIQYRNGETRMCEDLVATEVPLTIYLNAEEIVTLLCSPVYKEELAVGFLAASGLINDPKKIEDISLNHDASAVWITYQSEFSSNETFLKRYITTGCGMGTALCNNLEPFSTNKYQGNLIIDKEKIFNLMKEMQLLSQLYLTTGGAHSAALSNGEKIIVFREDIGRHNAVDKIIGHALLNNINLTDKILLTSGRISSEIILKIAKTGIGFIVSRSAPMNIAVKHAQALNMTVVGFVRGLRMNIYCGAERINL